ncbi:MAG: alpha/beta hydrolase fold domain-containing protein, partial [Rhodospirillaceae bacterium]|nr:alpha/beta hydrolase fold domain-containing protein [Rhodospirillaceae bacterium]
FYGAYDPGLESESCRLFGAEGAWLSVKEMQWCWKTYLGSEADRADPRAAPLRAGDAALKALPPLHLCAAGLDPLRDDTIRLAQRLAGLGMPHELSVRAGLGHSFLGFARMVDEARAALNDAGVFARRQWSMPVEGKE